MKTITNTISGAYTCDGCSGTASSSNAHPPTGWKCYIVSGNALNAVKNIDLCATCSQSGNPSGIAALAKILS